MSGSTIINFFGTGVRYWICRIPNTELGLLNKYKVENNLHWEQVFFNLEVLEVFGYKDWESIHLLDDGSGWLPVGNNWIEIRSGRKKRKISADEFLGSGFMFDLFKKVYSDSVLSAVEGNTDVLLLQLETGLIAKHVISIEQITLDQFTFVLGPKWMSDLLGMQWVEGLKYNGFVNNKTQDETLTRESRVMIIT